MIIVEDGTGKNDANSYASIADFKQYVDSRGLSVATDDASATAALLRAADYLEYGVNGEYVGRKINNAQALQWPREDYNPKTGVIESIGVPSQLKQAQLLVAYNYANGIDVMPTVEATDYMTEETVGPITTKYSDSSSISRTPVISGLDNLLGSLITGYGSLSCIRV